MLLGMPCKQFGAPTSKSKKSDQARVNKENGGGLVSPQVASRCVAASGSLLNSETFLSLAIGARLQKAGPLLRTP